MSENNLLSGAQNFLGMPSGTIQPQTPDAPRFRPGTDDFTDEEQARRRAGMQAATQVLFRTDISKLDDDAVGGLYRASAKALFGIEDPDGTVAFGRKRAGDARHNVELLRQFCKGDYSLIRDPEYDSWRAMDEEQKFRHALENESKSAKVKGNLEGKRGASLWEMLALSGTSGAPGNQLPQETREDIQRRMDYDRLTPEEQEVYRRDVIGRYDRKIAKEQVLATYLAAKEGMSDRAAEMLANSYSRGEVDVDAVEALSDEDKDRFYTALSVMRGDQKKGHLLGIPTDFTDDTAVNRGQLALYGLQQSVLGLVSDTWEVGSSAAKWAYAKTLMDDQARKDYFRRWNAEARAKTALEQGLPEADTWIGEMVQALGENSHWFIPYAGIAKGGKMAREAAGTAGALLKSARAAKGAADLEKGMVNLWARQFASMERFTDALRDGAKAAGAVKGKMAGGAAMWTAGEASAFSAFANEYISNCDAAGVSREESVPMSAIVGLVNAKIESLYVPGLESTLTPAQVKNLMMMSGLRALKSDGAAGFRRWLGNYVEKGLVEGAKVTLTEGAVEEPLQQFVQEWGKEIAQSAEELKKSGRGELGLALGKFVYDNFAADGGFERFAQRNLETYVETAVDMIPSSVGFGLTTNGRQKLAQHRRNRAVRKMNMARWRADVAAAEAAGREAPPAPLMLGLDEQNRMTFNPNGVDYDEGVVDLVQREIDTRRLVGDYWEGKGETEAGPGEDNRYVRAMTEARRIWRSGQGDKVNRIAEAAGVDHTTAEVIAQYLQTEQETAAFSPRVREYVGLAVSAADFSEETIRTVLPGYVDGSFMADDANGVYTAKVKLGDGSERTIAYKVGDLSDELKKMIPENERPDSEFGRSYDAQLRRGSDRDATPWAQLSDAERHKIATDAALGTYGMTEGSGGVFQMTDAKGNAVTVNADEIVRLSNGKLADIGYTALATMGTARHETFHALWKFAAASYTDAQLQETAKALGLDVTADTWKVDLDEEMAHQMEEYASGHYVSHIAETRIEKLMDTGAGWFVRMFGQRGLGDEVKNAKTGKSFTLKDFYDAVLKGEIGSGELGVRHTATEAAAPKAEKGKAAKSGVPVAVTDEERAQEAQDQAQAAAAVQPAEDEQRPEEVAQAAPRSEYTLNNPADATVPDARFYRVQAGDGVDIVGELVVSDANELKTSYKGTLEDGTLQNRAETEEGRALVEKIAGNPDPLQVGTVQPRANNGFIWATPSGNVFIGNTRETGITQAYARGNAENVRAYMLNEAKKRGLEIPEGVENPIVHFVLRDIQSKDGTAGIQDVVRLTNESVNRGMNVYEQAKNDADVMLKEKLVPGIELRADGRIDTERSAAAIGAFRRLTNAQGMIDADTGLLTEEGQTRLSNAVLAAFLASEDPTLTQKVIRDAGRLDMENERRALMRSAADLMALAEQKPQYDLRGPIAEALRYFTEWREADEAKRAEAGKTRRDWYARTKDGQRRRGIAWQEHMAQQDLFRRPSPAALIIGDLLAASRDLRSFEADDRETEAGKTRAQELVSRYLADFAQNARSANTETDDLFGAPPATVEEMLKAQRTKDGQRRFAVKAMNAAARRKDLLAVHNLDLGAIRKVAEIGGFAMPSIAVVKDSYVHSEFGDCTVLFDKSTIDPKRNRQNAIYSHDAWTPTFPKIVNEINVKAIEKANDGIMASLPEDVMDALRGDNYRLVYEDGMHDAWDSAEDAADAYADNLIMKAAYLVAKGEKVEPVTREKKYLVRVSPRAKLLGEEGLKTVHERVGVELVDILNGPGVESEARYAKVAPQIEEIIRDVVWERDYRNDPNVVKNGFTKEQCVGGMFADADSRLDWRDMTDIANAVQNYDTDVRRGNVGGRITDEWGTKDAIRSRVDENDPEYRAWINSRYANPILSKGVYNGKERFDARGNRRSWRQLHNEATLENIVKAMKKTQREHGSGFLGRNPFGVAVRKFKSIDDMITNEGILREMTPDEEKAVKEELSGRLGDLVSEYMASQKSPDQNKFTAYDHAADMMFDAWEASRGSFAGMKKELNGWGYSADDDLAERIWRVFDEMSVMPTNYFEAKPQREVYFNEMKAWIVPDTISADERKILDGNGQRVFTYRKDDLADRLRAVNEAADRTGTRFSVCSIGGRSVAVAETEPLTTKEAKDEQKVREIISRVIGQSFDQVGEAVPVKVDAKFADEFWGSTTSQKLRDKLDKLWRAKVSAIPILKDIVGNTPLGPSEAAKHINARFKKRVKFYRCPSEFGIKRHDGVAIYKCELLVLEMDSGTRYVYDLVKMTKPTLTAKSSLDGDLVQRLYGQTNLTGESATKVPEGTTQSVPPSAGNVNGENFKRWFDGSKIVDADGKPLVVYRGASFDPLAKEPGKGVIMPGAYFTADPEYAKRYGKVNAYYLNISNPLDVRNPAHAADLAKLLPQGYKFATGPMGALDWGEMASFDTEDLKEMGYDGIILDEGADYQSDGTLKNRGISYVPFDGGTQVKSATDNNGDYSLENRDVRFSIANLYTGSAADYEKPSLHYVGTGEGNQVYGWGLYASNQRGVAESYARGTHERPRELGATENKKILQKLIDGGVISAYRLPSGAYQYSKIVESKYGPTHEAIMAEFDESLRTHHVDSIIGASLDKARANEFRRENNIREKNEHIYEQTFFTNRAPGDESHLLSWNEKISEENFDRILNGLKNEGVADRFKDMWWLRYRGMSSFLESGDIKGALLDNGSSCDAIYGQLDAIIGGPQAASEFLARADIDGVKYPVDSYGGKTVKDGDTAGWNYVSFRDDNIRVDHKWVDGQKRFSFGLKKAIDNPLSAYFKEDTSAMEVPISNLRTYKNEREKSIVNAIGYMGQSARGEIAARAPVSVADNGDGTYVVVDGNATTWAATRMGMQSVMVRVVGMNTGTRLGNSAYLVNNDFSGCVMAENGKMTLHSNSLEGLSKEDALDKAYAQAEENAPILKTVLDAAVEKCGGKVLMRNGLKKRDRAMQKVDADYHGDVSRLVDITGGTIVLEDGNDFSDAIKGIRKSLPEGASIAQVKKFNMVPGAKGYQDVKVSIRFANGGIGEVIVVGDYMNEAKFNRGGHVVYDASRVLDNYKENDPEIEAVFYELDDLSKAIYGRGTEAPDAESFARMKAQASSSLTRLLGKANLRVSSEDVKILKSALSEFHLAMPPSVVSYAMPASSFMKKDISNSFSATGKTNGIVPESDLTVNRKYAKGVKFSYAFPRLDQMSGDQLVATAVATQMALGKSDKVSDRSVKITTVQKLIKGIHPEWSTHQVGVEALRVATEAQKLARKIREDLDRGVSNSLVLQHLPDAVREQFGQEMTQQARQGARLGAYHQRAMSAVEDKQAKVIEEAVKVQSGIETKLLENAYGVDLSQTLMNLVANPFLKKDANGLYVPAGGGEQAAQDQGEIVQADAPEKEVSDKARRAVDEVVAKSAEARAAEKESERMRGRDQENASGSGGEEDASLEGADIVDIATRKQGLNLEDPRQLAHFVAELARRYWVDTHGLAKDANAWADSVAVQFLRKTAANVYGKLAQEIAYSQARDVAARSIDGFGNIPTVQGLISEMTYVGQVINARKIRETQQQLCERLDLFLREKMGAQGRFKPDNEELHRKVSAEIELRARYMRHAMWLTPDAASEEAKELQRQMDAATVDFKGEGHDAEQARVMVENLRKLNVLREFGSLRYKPVAQIEAAIQYWEDLERGSGDEIARENLDREIRTKKAAAILAKAFHNPSRRYAREGKGVGDMLSDYLSSHMGFMNLLRDMTRYASKEDAAEAETILRYLELEIQKAGTKTEVEKRRHAEALASAVNSIYGRDFAKVLKEFAQKDDRFAAFMGAVDGHPVPPTKGRAIQLMVSLLQEGRKIEVEDPEHPGEFIIQWEGGYHDNIVKHGREKQAAEIAKLLTPADMNLVKWLGQWYEANRQELSQVCDSLFGIGVYAETSNYFPVKMLLEKQGLEKGEAVGWSIFPRALTPRVRNERDFDTSADVLQMFMSRMEEAAQWKAHAQLGLELRGIFGRSELQAAITSNHGNKVNQTVLGFVTDTLAGKGTVDRGDNGATYYTDMVRGWAALGALSLNVGVMFKQTTSIPAFGFEIGLRKTASHMVTAFTPEGMAAMRKIFDSDQRKVRWNTGNTEAVKNALAAGDTNWFMKMWRGGMCTNRLGDCVPALVVGQGIYREALENGMSEEDAMAYTWMLVERTQQSGRIENQAQFMRRSKYGRAIYQFLSTQQQYLQYEVRALRGVVAKPGDLGKWGDLARAAVLNHFILSSAYFWMGALYRRAFGDEPPEDELKDWVVSMLLGPYGALYGLGLTCTTAMNEWVKGFVYGKGSSAVPALSFVGNIIIRDPAAIVLTALDETKTWDDVLEKMGRFGADANALFRDLRKLKKNYWDD